MQSYSVRKYLESHISGINRGYTPSSHRLSALNYMERMNQYVNDESTKDTNLAKVASETMKYNSASVHAIATNPGIARAYGPGLDAVDTLEKQIQERQSKRVYDAVLDNVLDEADKDTNQKATHNKFNVKGVIKKLNLETDDSSDGDE
jgi:hypothetical protein